MKTMRDTLPEMTIEQFAEQHGLVMRVKERPLARDNPKRFYASFDGVEVMDGGFLVSEFGNGATEQEAVEAYAEAISLKRLAVDAMRPYRRNLDPVRIVKGAE